MKSKAVGLVALISDQFDLPRFAIDPVNGFLELERRHVPFVVRQDAVTGIREPYAAVRMHDDVIRGVEGFTLPAIRQDGHRSVMFVADDAAGVVLAGKQATFPVKGVSVAVVGRVVENADVTILLEPSHMHIIGNIAENKVAPAAIPCGSFGPKQSGVQPLDGGAFNPVLFEPFVEGDDVWIRVMNWGVSAPITLPRSGRGGSAGPCQGRSEERPPADFWKCAQLGFTLHGLIDFPSLRGLGVAG